MARLVVFFMVVLMATNGFGQTTKRPGEIPEGPPQRTAQFTGFFTLLGQFGHVVPLGYISQNSSIEITPVVLQLGDVPSNTPCRLKITLWIMGANNRSGQQRVIRRTGQAGQMIQINGTRVPGEGVVVIQTQNSDHVCLGSANIDVF